MLHFCVSAESFVVCNYFEESLKRLNCVDITVVIFVTLVTLWCGILNKNTLQTSDGTLHLKNPDMYYSIGWLTCIGDVFLDKNQSPNFYQGYLHQTILDT